MAWVLKADVVKRVLVVPRGLLVTWDVLVKVVCLVYGVLWDNLVEVVFWEIKVFQVQMVRKVVVDPLVLLVQEVRPE